MLLLVLSFCKSYSKLYSVFLIRLLIHLTSVRKALWAEVSQSNPTFLIMLTNDIFGTKGGDKESIIRRNLQYTAISASRRLPLDPGNPIFLHRAVQGVYASDPKSALALQRLVQAAVWLLVINIGLQGNA